MFINKDTHYDSLYFSGGAWIEVAKMDSMKLNSDANDFTIQFWVAGSDVYSNDGPALFYALLRNCHLIGMSIHDNTAHVIEIEKQSN